MKETRVMKIVILDGYALNPGDLDYGELSVFGQVVCYDMTSYDATAARIGDAEIVLTNKVVIDSDIMDKCPNMKYIGVMATGYNVVDIQGARKRNIVVTNIPNYSTDAVAQFTFSLILELANHVGAHSDSVMKGDWTRSNDFTYSVYPGLELSGKTLGIIGYGNIGKKVSQIARAFGMRVLVNSRTKRDFPEDSLICWADRETLFSSSDIVSLHCPLFPETAEIINKESLSMMKKTAFVINTARGGCVNERDLTNALNSGRIAGAALDVVSMEPMDKDNPLLTAKNVIITPHIAWAPFETRRRLLDIAKGNIKGYVEGRPVNVI